MLRATDLAHLLLRQILKPGDWTVDATLGNGHDALFLCDEVDETGRVFGFDIQEAALSESRQRLQRRPQIELIHAGHEQLADRLPEAARGRIAAAMFNLGYLPGAAREITTQAETSLAGLAQALDFLKPGGLVTVVLYTGHPGGSDEAAAVLAFAETLTHPFCATHFRRVNAVRPAPELLAIERMA